MKKLWLVCLFALLVSVPAGAANLGQPLCTPWAGDEGDFWCRFSKVIYDPSYDTIISIARDYFTDEKGKPDSNPGAIVIFE